VYKIPTGNYQLATVHVFQNTQDLTVLATLALVLQDVVIAQASMTVVNVSIMLCSQTTTLDLTMLTRILTPILTTNSVPVHKNGVAMSVSTSLVNVGQHALHAGDLELTNAANVDNTHIETKQTLETASVRTIGQD
jgi:hypothetical protein